MLEITIPVILDLLTSPLSESHMPYLPPNICDLILSFIFLVFGSHIPCELYTSLYYQ